MTAMNYLKTSFLLDFIPLVPLNFIDRIAGVDMHGHQNYFFLIKCSRMINAIQLFDINKLMKILKKLNERKVEFFREVHHHTYKCKHNDNLDSNSIDSMVRVFYILKFFKMFVIIVSLCYFFGLLWIIFTELIYHEINEFQTKMDDLPETSDQWFYAAYLQERGEMGNLILAMYYAWTSLSTVGLGDIRP